MKTWDEANADWGFPRFARDFPRDPELDRLVVAFTFGDYGAVRDGAPKLAKESGDEAVKKAAERLLEGTRPDRAVRILFALTGALLVFLTVWWLAHDHPDAEKNAPPAPPKIEYPDRK